MTRRDHSYWMQRPTTYYAICKCEGCEYNDTDHTPVGGGWCQYWGDRPEDANCICTVNGGGMYPRTSNYGKEGDA